MPPASGVRCMYVLACCKSWASSGFDQHLLCLPPPLLPSLHFLFLYLFLPPLSLSSPLSSIPSFLPSSLPFVFSEAGSHFVTQSGLEVQSPCLSLLKLGSRSPPLPPTLSSEERSLFRGGEDKRIVTPCFRAHVTNMVS